MLLHRRHLLFKAQHISNTIPFPPSSLFSYQPFTHHSEPTRGFGSLCAPSLSGGEVTGGTQPDGLLLKPDPILLLD